MLTLELWAAPVPRTRVARSEFPGYCGVAAIPESILEPDVDLNKPAYLAFEKLGKMPGVLMLALGITTGLAGAGLLRRKKWAWWIASAIFAINGLADVVTLLLTQNVMRGGSGILIAGVFLFLLTRPRVHRYFDEDARDRGFIR